MHVGKPSELNFLSKIPSHDEIFRRSRLIQFILLHNVLVVSVFHRDVCTCSAKFVWDLSDAICNKVAGKINMHFLSQGKCTWAGTSNRRVTLQDTQLRTLSDIERKVLCKVAVAKLQALNLGVHIRPPSGKLSAQNRKKLKNFDHEIFFTHRALL